MTCPLCGRTATLDGAGPATKPHLGRALMRCGEEPVAISQLPPPPP